jgi:Uma2 family endonuclease
MQAGVLTIEDRARLPATIFDHAGFRAWARSGAMPEGVRATFADGEVLIDMSLESSESHNKPKAEITRVLVGIAHGEDLGKAYADRMLLSHAGAALSTEPDFLFAGWEAFESGRLRLVEEANRDDDYIELEGTPDLVVEIVSDTSVRKDNVVLRGAYHRAGVPELWLIDAKTALSFQILHHAEKDYEPSTPVGSPQVSRVLSRRFELTRTKNRLGRWLYTLVAS